MAKSFDELSKNEKKFLKSIIGQGKKTDTEIAGETGLSVSTVNRIRHRFEDEGIIKEYISVIDLEGVSIDLYSMISIGSGSEINIEDLEAKNVVFAGKTDEANRKLKILMGHRNFESYQENIEKLRSSLDEDQEIISLEMMPEAEKENFVLRGRSSI